MNRLTCPVAVHLFLRKGDEILLLRRFHTGYEDGNYSVVAGHIDGGEDVYTAMIRESAEEAGIEIDRAHLSIVQVMHRKKPTEERIDYFFECRTWAGEVQNKEPDKCDQLTWAKIDELPDNTVDYIRGAIENYQKGIAFSLFGW